MKPTRRTMMTSLLALLLGCGGATTDEVPLAAAESEDLAFPSVPPDGPPPEIGPAPDTYRPTASGAPSTDIWLGSLSLNGESPVSDLRNLTDRDGYDNQPHFASNDILYYVSVLDATQSEVFRYRLGAASVERVTTTEASEFSPNAIPGQEAFSTIYELRGKQYLWRFGTDGTPLGAIFATAEPVGYQAWADETTVAMFILGSPATLQVGDAIEGNLRVIAENPGRSIHRIPGTNEISFVRKVNDGEWWIERLDPSTDQSERVIQTLPGREDYAWTPDGRLIMGDGPTLHIGEPGSEWKVLGDLSGNGIAAISRLAISPDGRHIAIVSNR